MRSSNNSGWSWGTQRDRSPRDFEDPQETYAAEDRDTERGHDGELHQDGLHNPTAHHETVKAIKQGHKVGLQPQAVHLHEHLQGEHCQENFVGNLCGEAEQENLSNVGRPGGPSYEFYELADQSGTNPELQSASLAGCSARRQWWGCWGTPRWWPASKTRRTSQPRDTSCGRSGSSAATDDWEENRLQHGISDIFFLPCLFSDMWWWNDSISADGGDYREVRPNLTNEEKTHGSVAIVRNMGSWQMR